jgi:hypothetical protein
LRKIFSGTAIDVGEDDFRALRSKALDAGASDPGCPAITSALRFFSRSMSFRILRSKLHRALRA